MSAVHVNRSSACLGFEPQMRHTPVTASTENVSRAGGADGAFGADGAGGKVSSVIAQPAASACSCHVVSELLATAEAVAGDARTLRRSENISAECMTECLCA